MNMLLKLGQTWAQKRKKISNKLQMVQGQANPNVVHKNGWLAS